MRATDQMLARLASEIEDKQTFIDGLIEDAEKGGRDLNDQELELITRTRSRLTELEGQMEPLKETRRISGESRQKLAELTALMREQRDREESENGRPSEPRYRSAGEYILDRWRGGLGNEEAIARLSLYHRAAAHQTTADNPGLLPEQILGPVVNFVDASRTLVSLLGPRQLPSGSWSRPKVTQHTSTGAQTAEKTELVSQKMIIGKVPVDAKTLGGYVNISRQDVDWTQPAIMDIVVNDLAGQYAIDTEIEACSRFTTDAPAGAGLPTGAIDPDVLAGALWAAVADILPATAGQGRIFAITSPTLMGQIGPLFPPVSPGDAQSPGFTAGALGTGGPVGSISGIPIYVSNGMASDTILVGSTAAAEVYEDRIGSLQVVEPSVLGVQVAYAGYFAALTMEANGLQKIVKTP